MIRVKTCFVAEGIAIDRESNQVSGFGLIERIDATAFPLLVPRLRFFCLWEREAADPAKVRAGFTARIDKRDLASTEVAIDFERFRRSRCVVRIESLMVENAGALVLRLAIPGHATAEWHIEVGDTSAASQAAPLADVTYDSMTVAAASGQFRLRPR